MSTQRIMGRLQPGDVLTDLALLGVVESVRPLPVGETVVVSFAGGLQLTGWAGEPFTVEPRDEVPA